MLSLQMYSYHANEFEDWVDPDATHISYKETFDIDMN